MSSSGYFTLADEQKEEVIGYINDGTILEKINRLVIYINE